MSDAAVPRDEFLAHALAAQEATREGFHALADAHATLARRELCACRQMFDSACPGPGRCAFGE